MRLIKKTVNQDDLAPYHLFCGDEIGHPSMELMFFDWPQAIRNRPGLGTVAAVGLRVPGAALDWWVRRFDMAGVPREAIAERGGRRTLAFTDPEGQRLQLIDDGGVPAELRGRGALCRPPRPCAAWAP